MWRPIPAIFAIGAVCASALPARADRTYLVGGTVIDGKATTKNGKVVIQTESGEIAVPVESVARIERGDPSVNHFDARYAALRPGDVHGRLELADYCRAHDLRARERKLLLEVIEIDRDNEVARTRLGYVKTEYGWLTQEEAMQTKGLVREDGKWVSRADLVEMQRVELEREALAQRKEEAEAAEHARRVDTAIRQAEIDEQRNHLAPSPYWDSYWAAYYPAIFPGFVVPRRVPFSRFPMARPVSTMPPAADSTAFSVVKVPYRH